MLFSVAKLLLFTIKQVVENYFRNQRMNLLTLHLKLFLVARSTEKCFSTQRKAFKDAMHEREFYVSIF